MSETKFTPAPWKVVPREILDDGSVYPTHIVGGVTELEVCHLEISRHTSFLSVMQGANFSLISCAPDLYAACARRLAELEFLDDPTDAQRAERAELFALLQRVRGE
ncbi:hypothetical protein [Robbsia andropogonis]|uniref:hypothetical protein n=1 Tax=Robbsia andropogonis TaxID=28092 RepID=UPI0012F7B9A9|nr:hypothetical protein [Robbsia andropogonis]